MEWISVKERFPEEDERILIKTDCDECPIATATFILGKFIVGGVIQCDKHYETDQKFHFIGMLSNGDVQMYIDRITHWMPYFTPESPKD